MLASRHSLALGSWLLLLHVVDLHMYRYILILILILILMLKLELPQDMQPRSYAPNAGVRAFCSVPAHVGPARLISYPPIPFLIVLPGSVEFKPIQALCCLVRL